MSTDSTPRPASAPNTSTSTATASYKVGCFRDKARPKGEEFPVILRQSDGSMREIFALNSPSEADAIGKLAQHLSENELTIASVPASK